jgi:hypothetical protein
VAVSFGGWDRSIRKLPIGVANISVSVTTATPYFVDALRHNPIAT